MLLIASRRRTICLPVTMAPRSTRLSHYDMTTAFKPRSVARKGTISRNNMVTIVQRLQGRRGEDAQSEPRPGGASDRRGTTAARRLAQAISGDAAAIEWETPGAGASVWGLRAPPLA